MVSTVVKVHDEVVKAKLRMAAPRIIAQNRSLVTAMLELVKPVVVAETPTGPGHFGYHGRDTVRIELSQPKAAKIRGQLKAAAQLYWREYGTRGRYHGRHQATLRKLAVGLMTGNLTAGGGEAAHMVANKAMSAARRFIGFYYGGMANWWRL